MTSTREAVCWGGPAVVTLFTLGRVEECLREDAFEIPGMRPDEIDIIRMRPEPDVKEVAVWEYDLVFHDVDQDIASYLLQCLPRVCAGAEGVAWSAFEGSFHFDHLFTDDVAEQIYGYCMAGEEPAVAWEDEIRKSSGWKRRISDARSAVERRFPAWFLPGRAPRSFRATSSGTTPEPSPPIGC
ncbi:hypothetical protein [Actinomadura sp. 21ATH]|uniref:hypothetical protein n=1 Tax=Actinomadura sp. 21ATH TaxID=1735444 RepID=UPI0035C23D7D